MVEGFADVVGFEGLYLVNKHGEIITLRNRNGKRGTRIKPFRDKDGYLRVKLYDRNGKKHGLGVHKIVATTFLPNPNHCEMVNHLNYIRDDNRLENLEWCTPQENADWSKHRYKGHGNIRIIGTDDVGLVKEYESMSQASKETGVSVGNICRCCHGYRSQAGGYKWSIA